MYHVFFSIEAAATRDQVVSVNGGAITLPTAPTAPVLDATPTGAAVVAFVPIFGQRRVDHTHDAGWAIVATVMVMVVGRRISIEPLDLGGKRTAAVALCSRGRSRGRGVG